MPTRPPRSRSQRNSGEEISTPIQENPQDEVTVPNVSEMSVGQTYQIGDTEMIVALGQDDDNLGIEVRNSVEDYNGVIRYIGECEECVNGDYCLSNEAFRTSSGHYVTPEDYEENYFTCADCGEVHSQSNGHYDDDAEVMLCEDCCSGGSEQEAVLESTDHQSSEKGDIITSPRTFGVELEVINDTTGTVRKLQKSISQDYGLHGDGSVSGGSENIEVVSPILRGKKGEESLRNMVKVMNDLKFKVNSTCGFHVHIGASDWSSSPILQEDTLGNIEKNVRGKKGNHTIYYVDDTTMGRLEVLSYMGINLMDSDGNYNVESRKLGIDNYIGSLNDEQWQELSEKGRRVRYDGGTWVLRIFTPTITSSDGWSMGTVKFSIFTEDEYAKYTENIESVRTKLSNAQEAENTLSIKSSDIDQSIRKLRRDEMVFKMELPDGIEKKDKLKNIQFIISELESTYNEARKEVEKAYKYKCDIRTELDKCLNRLIASDLKGFSVTRGGEWEKIRTLVGFHVLFGQVLFAMLPESRHKGNGYCKALDKRISLEDLSSVNSMDKMEKLWYKCTESSQVMSRKTSGKYDNSRYYGLNLHIFFSKSKTIEIRYHSGTTNISKILLWTALHQRILDMIHEGSITLGDIIGFQDDILLEDKIHSFLRVLKLDKPKNDSIEAKLKSYILERIKFFTKLDYNSKIENPPKKWTNEDN